MALPWSKRDKTGLARAMWMRKKGMGYFHEQSTQPQTLGYNLADSPAGLLAWIYEKLVNWTDDYPWTDDEGPCVPCAPSAWCLTECANVDNAMALAVLDWISVYWFSRAGPAASVRIYYEVAGEGMPNPPWSSVPLGVSFFPKELAIVPKL